MKFNPPQREEEDGWTYWAAANADALVEGFRLKSCSMVYMSRLSPFKQLCDDKKCEKAREVVEKKAD